ncbi:MAG: SRPBCC family protein [Chitinophagaceae bacterium]|nr:SRPBCC family protein [Chitinophagaceae bacterium]
MATIYNEITINAPVEKIWEVLANIEMLERYDPTVKKSIALSENKSGLNAKRKVLMLDNKNWFDEKVTVFKPAEALTYQLTDCSFPIKGLQHSYSFEKIGNQTKVKQVMHYTVKFGLLGKLLDAVMIRKQSDSGIKKFFDGLKSYAETN